MSHFVEVLRKKLLSQTNVIASEATQSLHVQLVEIASSLRSSQ